MEKVKKGLRIAGLLLLFMLALCGIPIAGVDLQNRERYRNREIRTEQIDRRENEEEEDQSG